MDLKCSYNALMAPSGTFIHLFAMFKNTAWQNINFILVVCIVGKPTFDLTHRKVKNKKNNSYNQ